MAKPQRREQLRHTAAVAGFVLVSAVVFWQSLTYLAAKGAASGGPQYNAAFVPELLAGTLLALCAIQLGRIWFGNAFRESGDGIEAGLEPAAASGKPDKPVTDEQEERLGLRAVVSVALLFAFVVGIRFLGYYIAMPLMLAGVFVTLGVRNVIQVVAWSIGLTLLAGYAFGELLNVALPPGFLEIAPW